jgi:hypothetical protein
VDGVLDILLLAMSLSHSLSHSLTLTYTPLYTTLQKDLVKRLRALTKVLETDDDVLVDSPAWPGLAATASLLVTDAYLQHADKEVRLYTVQACMELFAIVSTICILYSWSVGFVLECWSRAVICILGVL